MCTISCLVMGLSLDTSSSRCTVLTRRQPHVALKDMLVLDLTGRLAGVDVNFHQVSMQVMYSEDIPYHSRYVLCHSQLST